MYPLTQTCRHVHPCRQVLWWHPRWLLPPVPVRSGSSLDPATLIKLGDLVYRGGGKELVSIVNDIHRGKPVSL